MAQLPLVLSLGGVLRTASVVGRMRQQQAVVWPREGRWSFLSSFQLRWMSADKGSKQRSGGDYLFYGPIPQEALTATYSRSGGAGGQHVNKVSTKVTLRFNVDEAYWLTEEAKAAIKTNLSTRMNKQGELVVQCQDTRSQNRNYDLAVQRMTEMCVEATKQDKEASAQQQAKVKKLKRQFNERRLKEKKKQSQKKADRKGSLDF
ncbi:hypothetical protein PTSG_01889 [Salpingoeca rosetta]|uniref:Prokaryotic-type class I peptide chain release factors domain-containing protein n=1 Tax=Salpingoeca rosetta (strain ATCC 50818 / BSB-021) TaxID=946362 RepID=F2TZ90_SALR5|nr:uncharacterized protein PTSG_01889 [Salpingoeca rosetta]EGD78914.1 hypothetical protein PTSG_01889 [Salpingoeca rosetta]|eukprot:XP_004997870.1 hypothetical protein PTSG_01889 [Salpingoeca rosetta]